MEHIHTGIFQGKIKNFPGLKTPPVRSSDPTVQYSVGPMVRSYTRYVPILRTFFITEFRGSRSSCLTCEKKVKNFPGEKLSRAKLSRGKLSRGKLSRGKTFQGKLSRENGKCSHLNLAQVWMNMMPTASQVLHEVRMRCLTTWDGWNPVESRGHFQQ